MFQSDDRSSLEFQYFRGRLLYVNLEGAAIESYAFDQQSGEGACGKVIAHLRKTGSVERILPGVAWDGSAL